MNKHLAISLFLLLLYVSAAAAAPGRDTIDETGTSAKKLFEWLWEQLSEIFWLVVPICLLVGAAYMVWGSSSVSAEGQKRMMNVLKGVAALYVGLWIVASIKAL